MRELIYLIVKAVRAKGGDYCVALKANQPNFYKDVEDYFDEDRLIIIESGYEGGYQLTREKNQMEQRLKKNANLYALLNCNYYFLKSIYDIYICKCPLYETLLLVGVFTFLVSYCAGSLAC